MVVVQKNYKMVIEYDGSRYKGWQSQKNTDVTIQGKLNSVFSALEGRAVEVQGSGRTDAGVHAAGQAANVQLTVDLPPEKIKNYVNHYLPEDIGVLELNEVPARFHARLSAVKRLIVIAFLTAMRLMYLEENGCMAFQNPWILRQCARVHSI